VDWVRRGGEGPGPERYSVEKYAGDGSGGVGRQIGDLHGGPLVPLCTQAQPVDLR
jgi:hypothetical protein